MIVFKGCVMLFRSFNGNTTVEVYKEELYMPLNDL